MRWKMKTRVAKKGFEVWQCQLINQAGGWDQKGCSEMTSTLTKWSCCSGTFPCNTPWSVVSARLVRPPSGLLEIRTANAHAPAPTRRLFVLPVISNEEGWANEVREEMQDALQGARSGNVTSSENCSVKTCRNAEARWMPWAMECCHCCGLSALLIWVSVDEWGNGCFCKRGELG